MTGLYRLLVVLLQVLLHQLHFGFKLQPQALPPLPHLLAGGLGFPLGERGEWERL